MTLLVCLLVGLAASVEDLWRRRVSNITVLAGLAAGWALQVYLHGWWRGMAGWGAGAAAGLGVLLIFFIAGGMGGGDVKLMAAFGACLGVRQVLLAALLAAIAGAVWAVVQLAWHAARRRPGSEAAPESFPRVPSLFLGVLLSFLA